MLDHPYTNLSGGQWLRGNLHTHTTRSDGDRPPQEVLDDYADRGNDFLMISDHDICTSTDDYAQWNTRNMTMIPGNEVTAAGPHLLHVGGERRIDPHPDRQRVIDEVRAAAGFAIMNHPNWQEHFDHCPLAKLQAWDGYAGIEIYNGVIGRLHGSPYATDKWDMLLAAGRRVWGFANDDSHAAEGDIGLGWNVAYVTDPTPAGVINALAAGRFYASTGVTISDIAVDGRRIRIEAPDARRIVALTDVGRRLAVSDDSDIEIECPQGARYVRFECWGDGEQFAWTQPFWSTTEAGS